MFLSLLNYFRSYRFRRACFNKFLSFQNQVSASFYGNNQIKVLSGPFRGLKYFNEVVWGLITPRWIGSYEDILHEIFYNIALKKGYDVILDIGAAEGYYAVGLAWLLPKAKVFAFDIDPFARKLQAKLANLNNITNLFINARCSYSAINRLVKKRCLIICDIEGQEFELLNPLKARNLQFCDILLETHRFNNYSENEVVDIMKKRFLASHKVSVIHDIPKDITFYYKALEGKLAYEVLNKAVNECRSNQCWMWLEAKSLD